MSKKPKSSLFGSMGLHQNNIKSREIPFEFLSNRNIIDVFREFRNKYFGTPTMVHTASSRSSDLRRQYSSSSIDSEDINFASLNGLPIYCKLMILSFLSTKDVCSISCTNRSWKDICNDQLLWRELLLRDMTTWDDITDKSHPLLPHVWSCNILEINAQKTVATSETLPFREISKPSYSEEEFYNFDPDTSTKPYKINFKALYIHSAFQRLRDNAKERSEDETGLHSIIKSWWTGGKTEQNEYVIFGPGMEATSTSKIFLNMLWNNDFITTKGLLQGNREGLGSGVKIEFKERVMFKLIAMYSSNARLRGKLVGVERLLNSNFLESTNSVHDIDFSNVMSAEEHFVIHESFKSYLTSCSDFKMIFVVNATSGQEFKEFVCNRIELNCILNGTKLRKNETNREEDVNEAIAAFENNLSLNTSSEDSFEETPSSSQCMERPLLILACVKDENETRLSSVQIAALLNLPRITNRSWRVQNVVVSSMDGMESGLEWLIRQM